MTSDSTTANHTQKALGLLLLILPLATLIFMVATCSAPVPREDDYDAILAYLNRPPDERIFHIADFHNEHRILTARLVFEAIVRTMGHFDFSVCMTIGAIFLYGYSLLFRQLFSSSEKNLKWLGISFLWLIASFLNYDNVCWAMTSVSNVPVHFWALLSLLLAAKRRNFVFFALSLVCAALATFSTGAGMSIWGALAILCIHDNLRKCNNWESMHKALKSAIRPNWASAVRLVTGAAICLVVVCCYFGGFKSVSDGHTFSLYNAAQTFLALSGAIIPIWPVALTIGIVILFAIVWIVWKMPQIKNTVAFAFLAYLFAVILSVAIFRSYDPPTVLACRMRIVPISLLGVVMVLLSELTPTSKWFTTKFSALIFVGSLAYLMMFTSQAFPMLRARRAQLLNGIAAWPKDLSGLSPRIDEQNRFNTILHNAVKYGVYLPPKSH